MVIYKAIGSPGHGKMLLMNQIKQKVIFDEYYNEDICTGDKTNKSYSDLNSSTAHVF